MKSIENWVEMEINGRKVFLNKDMYIKELEFMDNMMGKKEGNYEWQEDVTINSNLVCIHGAEPHNRWKVMHADPRSFMKRILDYFMNVEYKPMWDIKHSILSSRILGLNQILLDRNGEIWKVDSVNNRSAVLVARTKDHRLSISIGDVLAIMSTAPMRIKK